MIAITQPLLGQNPVYKFADLLFVQTRLWPHCKVLAPMACASAADHIGQALSCVRVEAIPTGDGSKRWTHLRTSEGMTFEAILL